MGGRAGWRFCCRQTSLSPSSSNLAPGSVSGDGMSYKKSCFSFTKLKLYLKSKVSVNIKELDLHIHYWMQFMVMGGW
jgi:hypothetical protein